MGVPPSWGIPKKGEKDQVRWGKIIQPTGNAWVVKIRVQKKKKLGRKGGPELTPTGVFSYASNGAFPLIKVS